MNTTKEDLLLHPIRLRIIMAAVGRQVTAQQLAREMPDIPQATLYRNLNILSAADILAVVQERRTRNTVEKVYALQSEDMILNANDLAQSRPEEYVRLFTRYLGQMLGYYSRYASQEGIDHVKDHVIYQLLPVNLSEAEFQEMAQALNSALAPYIQNEPSPERRRVILSFALLPDTGAGAAGSEDLNKNQK